MLQISDLNVYYEAIHALQGVSLEVSEGEIVTLIGANGAGKSTLLKTISGLVRPRSGTINFIGYDLTKLPPHKIVCLGIAQVPEGRRIFANLSVLDNLELGAYIRKDNRIKKDLQKVFDIFPALKDRKNQLAGTLSGGEQQMLSIARALMANPKLLLLDEPSLGLAPMLVKEIFRVIQEIRARGTTILLVEQNAHMALHIADKGYILETGRVVMSGPAQNLLQDELLKKAYLGE